MARGKLSPGHDWFGKFIIYSRLPGKLALSQEAGIDKAIEISSHLRVDLAPSHGVVQYILLTDAVHNIIYVLKM